MGRYPAVHGHGIFHGHIRLFAHYILKENPIYGITFSLETVCVHLYPSISKSLKAFSCHHSIWIVRATVHFSDLVLYNCIHTWRLLAKVAAWLKCHIHNCPLRIRWILQAGKCCTFRMELSISHMISLSYDPSILHYDGTDKRIGIHRTSTTLCQLYGTPHVRRIKFIIYITSFHMNTFPLHSSLNRSLNPAHSNLRSLY